LARLSNIGPQAGFDNQLTGGLCAMIEGHLHNLPFIVIGGGIGGTAAALALSRKGKRVLVLEQAVDLTEIGAGIQMPPNAFKAFDALGVLKAVQQVAAYPERLVLGDMLTGTVVYQTPIGDALSQGRPRRPAHSRSRCLS
jgi:2-polyprenyl-6-methoxyphenol hydroxylase-like FAD-dependent oxidoreductase